MKAYLYYYGISNLDNFAAYFMDYLIYGIIYKTVGWNTDFFEINFAPDDILCYNLNGYDGTASSATTPTYSQANADAATGVAGSVTCTQAASV